MTTLEVWLTPGVSHTSRVVKKSVHLGHQKVPKNAPKKTKKCARFSPENFQKMLQKKCARFSPEKIMVWHRDWVLSRPGSVLSESTDFPTLS